MTHHLAALSHRHFGLEVIAFKIDTVSISGRLLMATGSVNRVDFEKLTRCQFSQAIATSPVFLYSLPAYSCGLALITQEIDTVSISSSLANRRDLDGLMHFAFCPEVPSGAHGLDGILRAARNISTLPDATGCKLAIFSAGVDRYAAKVLSAHQARMRHVISGHMCTLHSAHAVCHVSSLRWCGCANDNSLVVCADVSVRAESGRKKLTRCQFMQKQSSRQDIRARSKLAGELAVRHVTGARWTRGCSGHLHRSSRIDTVSISRCGLSRRTTESEPETLGNSGGFWFWGLTNPCATNSRKERAFDSVNHH